MVECDYPHQDSTWPNAQQMIRKELAEVDPAIARMVCFENAAALFQHPLPPAELIDSSQCGRPSTGDLMDRQE